VLLGDTTINVSKRSRTWRNSSAFRLTLASSSSKALTSWYSREISSTSPFCSMEESISFFCAIVSSSNLMRIPGQERKELKERESNANEKFV
jgi:hypothetical protein